MGRERTDYERLMDNAVLLTLWARTQQQSQKDHLGDRLKLMKLAFLTAYPLYWERVKALNLRFFRYKYGPYTSQVNASWDELTERRLMTEEEVFAVTDSGMRLADSFYREVLSQEENQAIRQTLDRVVDKYGTLSTDDLLSCVYEMECYTLHSPGTKRKVNDIPYHRDLTDLLEEEEAEQSLWIPPGWLVTLELTFDPDALRNLERGIEDTHAGRVYEGWEALGADV